MLNIIKIIDKDSADVVKYYYNSFGVVTSNIISVNEDDCTYVQYNPFIYKGYYYDKLKRAFNKEKRKLYKAFLNDLKELLYDLVVDYIFMGV